MGATSKLAAVAAKLDAKNYAKLTERHVGILAPGESITCTLSAVAPDTPQTNAVFAGALGGMVGYFIGQAIDRPKARARAQAICEHIGGQYSQFPASKNGYKLATTQLRVLVFDGKAKELVSEGPIGAMHVSSIDHTSELSSLIFSDGTEHIAVTALRGHTRGVEMFVDGFASGHGLGNHAMASSGIVEF